MPVNIVPLMRLSLWLLLIAAALIALFWLMLVVASGFTIWTNESNAAGLTLQAGLVLSPGALFLGLKLSKHSIGLSTALFILSWLVAFSALIVLHPL
ncbi:hypothetical protein WG908_05980 [Sphingobium sp. AN641]|uniref:hypothetical protein n=1 Tax=Sphingobium sp. AN641 TaxID=3133443 RepID=UPI0030C02726